MNSAASPLAFNHTSRSTRPLRLGDRGALLALVVLMLHVVAMGVGIGFMIGGDPLVGLSVFYGAELTAYVLTQAAS